MVFKTRVKNISKLYKLQLCNANIYNTKICIISNRLRYTTCTSQMCQHFTSRRIFFIKTIEFVDSKEVKKKRVINYTTNENEFCFVSEMWYKKGTTPLQNKLQTYVFEMHILYLFNILEIKFAELKKKTQLPTQLKTYLMAAIGLEPQVESFVFNFVNTT